jgi:hypothetical protein
MSICCPVVGTVFYVEFLIVLVLLHVVNDHLSEI